MSFEHEVSIALDRMKDDVDTFIKNVNTKLFTSIIKDTPIDTGRARGNWQTTSNTPSSVQYVERKEDGSVAEAVNVLSAGPGLYWMANNLPYIERLEYGYSKQAPAGMVRKNAARIASILRSSK